MERMEELHVVLLVLFEKKFHIILLHEFYNKPQGDIFQVLLAEFKNNLPKKLQFKEEAWKEF